MAMRSGGQILVDQLVIQETSHVFCVPGESFLNVLDALYDTDTIKTVTCRQEGGAAMMAEAHGKLAGRPGICFVTRGPGATNASAGVHIAYQDSTPMILFIGQVATGMADREAFQEVDFTQMFAPLAKWAGRIDTPERIPEYVSRAFHLAMSGRPGPVVLALPEDVLSATADTRDMARATRIEAGCDAGGMNRLRELLASAERPLALVGGGGWSQRAADDMAAFAANFDLPVAATFRCQDYFDNTRDHYAGHVGIGINPKLAQRIRDADLVLCIGARLGEMTTGGYTLLESPQPRQRLVHIYPAGDELGRVYRPVLGINAASGPATRALAQLASPNKVAWGNWRAQARADYLDHIKPQKTPGSVRLEDVVVHLRETLGPDAIITNGAGNYCGWVNRYYQYRPYRTQLGPTSGSMGYGLPAAIAAKLACPQRTVVTFAGDGCFLMTGQELATAVQYDLALIVIVCNNAMFGTIRMHQEREHPGRVSATSLKNPDFAALARSFGAHGEQVRRSQDFPAAFERAAAAGGPALIEILMDPEALAPALTLSDARR